MSKKQLGRLTSLGIETLEQVALYLPKDYVDLSCVIRNERELIAAINSGQTEVACYGWVGGMEVKQANSTTMLKIQLWLADRFCMYFSLFGARHDVLEQYNAIKADEYALVHGFALMFGSETHIKSAKVLPERYCGCIMPRYEGKARVIKPETVRERVEELLPESIPLAANFLRSQFSHQELTEFIDPSRLELALAAAHHPEKLAHAERANFILESLATLAAKKKVIEHFEFRDTTKVARIDATRWHENATQLPFTLTSEQVNAINGIAKELNKGSPLRSILQGDVGTGKTVVFGLLGITAALNGYRVGIMMPNVSLAAQVHHELTSYMKTGLDRVHLVTGDSELNNPALSEKGGHLIVGTTAMLFRELGDFDLIVVDEQHKFGTQQRMKLLQGRAHLIEASATPIPRSIALVKLGVMKAWRLTAGHANKRIESHILLGREEGKVMMARVHRAVQEGEQALIVYALKSETESQQDMVSAEKAFELWDRRYPGKVRLVHSGLSNEEKVSAIDDMKQGRASILVATSVIEVGVTIPKATVMGVINADRFGASSLHQIRGRLCRHGGEGDFYMVLPEGQASEKTLMRLQALVDTTDGYEIAERELEQKGAGDLAIDSTKQHGSDDSILVGRKVRLFVES
jgi:ATP-dependent DNA helicase RecG